MPANTGWQKSIAQPAGRNFLCNESLVTPGQPCISGLTHSAPQQEAGTACAQLHSDNGEHLFSLVAAGMGSGEEERKANGGTRQHNPTHDM